MSKPRSINARIARSGLRMGAGVRARIDSGRALEAPTTAFDTPNRPLGPQKPANRQEMASGGSPLAPIFAAMSEKQFQAMVVMALKAHGYMVWTVPDMTKTARGLPDVIAVHPTRVPRRVLFYELKSQRGRVRPEQADALAALSDVHGIDARIVRPSDWPALRQALDSGEPDAAGEGQ